MTAAPETSIQEPERNDPIRIMHAHFAGGTHVGLEAEDRGTRAAAPWIDIAMTFLRAGAADSSARRGRRYLELSVFSVLAAGSAFSVLAAGSGLPAPAVFFEAGCTLPFDPAVFSIRESCVSSSWAGLRYAKG